MEPHVASTITAKIQEATARLEEAIDYMHENVEAKL